MTTKKDIRICIVNDSKSTLDAFADYFKYQGYVQIQTYVSGRRVLEELRNGRDFDVAIIDRQLGYGVSGDYVMHEFKEKNLGQKLLITHFIVKRIRKMNRHSKRYMRQKKSMNIL